MEWLRNFVDNVLDPISIVIGIILAFPIFWTWWEVTLGRRRLHKRWFREIAREAGGRPAVLVVDLLEKKDISTSVEAYRKRDEQLKGVPDSRVFNVRREGRIRPDDMPALATEIRNVAGEIIRAGTDTVHLFYAGPVIPPAMIGAEFANTCRVILYQHTQDGYQNWGPLRHDF